MDFLDVPTVLQVSALFNLFAALAWLALAQVLRIAPRAGRLMAAGHALRLLSDAGATLAGGPPLLRVALTEFGLLACTALLLLALRRLLRSRARGRDLAWVGGLAGAAIGIGLIAGSGLLPRLASTAAATLVGCSRCGRWCAASGRSCRARSPPARRCPSPPSRASAWPTWPSC